jgi:hypothetical protein
MGYQENEYSGKIQFEDKKRIGEAQVILNDANYRHKWIRYREDNSILRELYQRFL